MIDAFASLAFLGDFHPVAVHFPIALLPTVLLLKLYRIGRPEPWVGPTVNALLGLALVFTLLAVALGITTRGVNGFNGEAVDAHAILGLTTLALLLLTTVLHSREDAVRNWLAGHRPALHRALRATSVTLITLWRTAKWLVIIALFPLVLLYLLLRSGYRRLLKARLQPLRQILHEWLRGTSARYRRLLQGFNTFALWKNASYAATLVLVLVTGLKGADLSHGEGHLLRNMPPAMVAFFGGDTASEANQQLDRAFYESKLLPTFRRSCIKCHGPDKQKAGLRLDSYAAVIESGAIQWQDPYGSDLIRRILLPRDQDGAMPPRDRSRELRAEDISAIVAWVQGHSLETLAQQGGGLPDNLKTLADALPVIESDVLEHLNDIEGIQVMRLVEGYDLLTANLGYVPADKLDAAFSALAPYTRHIVELNLSGKSLSEGHWQAIADMRELRRLNLRGSDIGDQRLASLGALRRLQWLNLFGTAVILTDEDIQRLLPGLQTVYLPGELVQKLDS